MRMGQLDTLRAIAIGLVMVEHYGGEPARRYFPVGAGSLGVGLFFTLSGFLITGILLDGFARGPSRPLVWRDFYIRRVMRLAPAYYAVLAALVLIGIQPIAGSWPWHAAYLTNFWITLGNPSNVFWTLAVEEQFYLLWPFLIALLPRRWLIPAALGLIAASLAFKFGVARLGIPGTGKLLPANLTPLAIGCILAVVSYRGGRPNNFEWYRSDLVRGFRTTAAVAAGFSVLAWGMTLGRDNPLAYYTLDLFTAVVFGWLVIEAAAGITGRFGTLMNSPALQYVGRISYGLYLVHNWMPDIVEKFAGPLPRLVAGPIVLALTFGICALSWRFYEQPMLSLGRRLTGRPHRPAPAAATEVDADAAPQPAVAPTILSETTLTPKPPASGHASA